MANTKIFQNEIKTALDQNETARQIIEKIPIYYDESKIWYIWNKSRTCWERVDEIDILNSIHNELQLANLAYNHIRTPILNALMMEARKKKPKDLKPTQIQYKNTIVDISTGEEIPATPEYYAFNPIPWGLSQIPDTPIIDKLISDWVGPEKLELIKQWISYCMLCDYPIARVLCLHGTGANGKSTLIQLIKRIIGKHNISAGSLETTFTTNFGLTDLHRKTALFMGETNFNRISKTDNFKRATGNDDIKIEYKNKTPFTYNNYAKVTIATNSIPITEDKTDGYYRRWMIVDFPNKYKERKNPIHDIPEQEYEQFCRQSITHLKNLLSEGTFRGEGDIDERRQEYEHISNPIHEYLEQNYTEDPESFITRKLFNTHYKKWLKENGHRIPTDREITKQMKEIYETGNRPDQSGLLYLRSWLGIRLKPQKYELNTKCV